VADHFEWLAIYQCGNASLQFILEQAGHAGGKSSISKGMHRAAKLAQIRIRGKRRKLKSD
jgi:hypothetical protein